jgi:hypothetical protein
MHFTLTAHLTPSSVAASLSSSSLPPLLSRTSWNPSLSIPQTLFEVEWAQLLLARTEIAAAAAGA